MEYTNKNVFSTLHLCWGAQAGLYYHYRIEKIELNNKLFGIFKISLKNRKSELTRGFDDEFFAPHSRYTTIDGSKLKDIKELNILAESDETGLHIIATQRFCRAVFGDLPRGNMGFAFVVSDSSA